jgi:hypothetical protein
MTILPLFNALLAITFTAFASTGEDRKIAERTGPSSNFAAHPPQTRFLRQV